MALTIKERTELAERLEDVLDTMHRRGFKNLAVDSELIDIISIIKPE